MRACPLPRRGGPAIYLGGGICGLPGGWKPVLYVFYLGGETYLLPGRVEPVHLPRGWSLPIYIYQEGGAFPLPGESLLSA
jgi:hypothetical protein